jgi:hypothetical protein
MAGKDILPDKWVVKSEKRRWFTEREAVCLLLGEKYGSMSHVCGV